MEQTGHGWSELVRLAPLVTSPTVSPSGSPREGSHEIGMASSYNIPEIKEDDNPVTITVNTQNGDPGNRNSMHFVSSSTTDENIIHENTVEPGQTTQSETGEITDVRFQN